MDKTEFRREIEQGETFVFGEKNLIHEKLNNVTSYVKKSRVLALIDRLDEQKPEVLIAERRVIKEPEKVVIPQFVADWIKRQLAYGYENVFIAMNRVMGGGSNRLINWFDSNQDTFARAWLDGYKIEEEKHPLLEAFDDKAKEYENYESTSHRLQEIRKVLVKALKEVG